MTLLTAFLIFGGWATLAAVLAVLVGMAMGFDPDDPPLLLRYADDRDRRRMVDAAEAASVAYLYAEREALELDYVLSLPAREPRA